MRGLLKAAAFLSSTLTSAFVIPDPAPLGVRPADDIIEHREHPMPNPESISTLC